MDLAFEEFKTEDGTITQTESKNQKLKRVTNCVQKNKQKNSFYKIQVFRMLATGLMLQSGGKKRF